MAPSNPATRRTFPAVDRPSRRHVGASPGPRAVAVLSRRLRRTPDVRGNHDLSVLRVPGAVRLLARMRPNRDFTIERAPTTARRTGRVGAVRRGAIEGYLALRQGNEADCHGDQHTSSDPPGASASPARRRGRSLRSGAHLGVTRSVTAVDHGRTLTHDPSGRVEPDLTSRAFDPLTLRGTSFLVVSSLLCSPVRQDERLHLLPDQRTLRRRHHLGQAAPDRSRIDRLRPAGTDRGRPDGR